MIIKVYKINLLLTYMEPAWPRLRLASQRPNTGSHHRHSEVGSPDRPECEVARWKATHYNTDYSCRYCDGKYSECYDGLFQQNCRL